ncbi:hypothetical protein [Streptomyces yangpuensis]|uniref:hypothetical protein n=1 Tax=Streptomyces yangpuensis TaxID=1648182 RepID=UPI0035D9BEA8
MKDERCRPGAHPCLCPRPGLIGKGGWINTGGKDLKIADLRGKCIVVDFGIS